MLSDEVRLQLVHILVLIAMQQVVHLDVGKYFVVNRWSGLGGEVVSMATADSF